MHWLTEYKFYLQSDVCQEINSIRQEIESKMDLASIRIVYQDFIPYSEMNNSYFLDNE